MSHIHVRHLNPFPADFKDQLAGFRKVVVAELNLGQLVKVIRERFLIEAVQLNKIQGLPFTQDDLVPIIEGYLKEMAS